MDLENRIREHRDLLSGICCPERKVNLVTLEHVLHLAMEISREGREGKKIGTLFIISDTEEVLKRSRPLILDPLSGHPPGKKIVSERNARETIKELAQMDGAFLVSDDGIFLSACRYINATSDGIQLPLGLGSRHMAAASITKNTDAVAVVLSESSMVRIFDNGEIIGEIIPELWMLKQYASDLSESNNIEIQEELTLVLNGN